MPQSAGKQTPRLINLCVVSTPFSPPLCYCLLSMYVRARACERVFVRVRACVHVRACIRVCMCVCVCVCVGGGGGGANL